MTYLKIALLSLISIFSLAVGQSFAQTTSTATSTPPVEPTVINSDELSLPRALNPETENAPENLDKSTTLKSIKDRGGRLIRIRLEILDRLLSRVADSKLSAEQKTKLQADIAANVTDLKALLAKIDAKTDPANARNLVKSIYTDFRIFAVFIPRVSGLMHAWFFINQIANINNSLAKVEIKIAELKAKGVTTTKMETLADQIKPILATGKEKFETAAGLLDALKPADYPGSKDTLRRVREMLKNGQKETRKSQHVISELNMLLREQYLLLNLEARHLRLNENQIKNLQKIEKRRNKILEQSEQQKNNIENQTQNLQEKLDQKIEKLEKTLK